MADSSVVVGIDIGTSSTKVVAYDRHGRIKAQEAREYPLRSPLPDRAEQDPEQIFESLLDSLSEVARSVREDGEEVYGVALGAAMHTLIALDERERPSP